MSGRPACQDTRSLAAELAFEIAPGKDRAAALDHLGSCADCRRHVEELSGVADDLLLLAPEQEPPPGFEARAAGALADQLAAAARRPTPSRGRRTVMAAAVAAVLGLALGAFGVFLATGDQREDAGLYRRALEHADGAYFGATPLRDPAGRRVGHVFEYAGETTWLFLVVGRSPASGAAQVTAELRNGGSLGLGSIVLEDGRGTLGVVLPVRLRELAGVRVTAPDGASVARARFPAPDAG